MFHSFYTIIVFKGRQKLARFNAIEFATLIVDLLHDAKNREGLNTENQSAGKHAYTSM